MASYLQTRSKWIGAFSILSIGLLTLWFLWFEPSSQKLVHVIPVDTSMGLRPHVELKQGTIIGINVQEGYPQMLEEFLGVPYGLPTGGENRFKPPIPITTQRTEPLDAGSYGIRCPAGAHDVTPQGEACLNLNIYRPKARDQLAKLPVLIYLHGGSFNFGAGQTRQISSLVAWSAQPIIGISFNYRIGAFGFLPSKLMAKEGLLNVGLKDQALLFQWVRDNIAEFGGDPMNVTLMGTSAGAHSIGHHLLHDTDKPPLFQRVIMESGAATSRAVYGFDHQLHETQFQEFLTKLGCETLPKEEVLPTLRNKTTEEIKKASEAIFKQYDSSVRWPFQPVIDGKGGIITVRPINAWKSSRFHNVPILTGYNTNEGARFVPSKLSNDTQFRDFFRTLLPQLSEADLDLLAATYPDPVTDPESPYQETRKSLGAQYSRLEQAYGHFAYVAPVRQTAEWASSAGVPVYMYHFDVSTSVNRRADHGVHSPFVTFSSEARLASDSIEEISGMMHAYWTSFIATGDPNAVPGRYEGRMKWPAYDRKEGRVLMFGEGNDEMAGGTNKGVLVQLKDDGWASEECTFWTNRTELFEQ